MKKLFTALVMLLAMQTAFAIEIGDAKSQGLVGEANTGYLAAVGPAPSAEVRALIADVNSKRKAEFESTAAKTGATVDQVRARFYQLAVQKTAPGNFYQDPSGAWKKK
ncbi:MAG TPA: YdbL family protein [Woeseiaceae bacterium]|nr:YdbL family protein [Woeseiaceae bacterium]